ncbi:MAG TPA: PaaI family thioesterase [Acidimicrobiales bacterium]|nr:PaaI family thioesterase [Acidimicrobiales bacterium]
MSDERVRSLNEFGRDKVPGLFGMEMTRVDEEGSEARLTVTETLIAGTGYLFAPVVVGMADIICAFGMGPHIPEGSSFTTVELKTNFLSSAKAGEVVTARAWPVHVGRTTVVWDAVVTNETTGRTMALFRNTQLVILPRA